MAAIEGLSVDPIELAHADRKGRLRGFDEQVVVILHEAIRVTAPPKARDHMRQGVEKCLAIGVVLINPLARIAARG